MYRRSFTAATVGLLATAFGLDDGDEHVRPSEG